jgi:hypothetical protein
MREEINKIKKIYFKNKKKHWKHIEALITTPPVSSERSR